MTRKINLFLFIIYLFDSCTASGSSATLTFGSPTNARKKKLWFLFAHKSHRRGSNDEPDFYCPRKHIVTPIEDLCFYFHRHKKPNHLAEQTCRNVSHRLVQVENHVSWSALLYAVDKFVRRVHASTATMTNSSTSDHKAANRLSVFRFHVGRVNQPIENKMVWNLSGIQVPDEFVCDLTWRQSMNGCVELVSGGSSVKSRGGHSWCLKSVGCESLRYAVCEWRGATIQSFSAHLEAQLLNAYVWSFGVLAAFIFIWSVIYILSRSRIRAQVCDALLNYQIECELFADETERKIDQ